jgi:hypothetical protein
VISSGAGFSILASPGGQSPATITTYTAAGSKLAVITGGFTAICGAADVAVPGIGRLVITELITSHAAKGIQPATSSVDLTAWNAASGAKVWTAVVVRSVTTDLSCITESSLSYLAGGPDLLYFGVTTDGRWGVYANGSQSPQVIDLSTGATTSDPTTQGTLGPYLVDACQPGNSLLVLNTLTSPQTGRAFGKSTTEADAYHVNASCPASAAAGAVPNLLYDTPNPLELAVPGLFFTDSAGTSPGTGLTSTGNGLLVDNSASVNISNPDIARYSLPAMRPVWKKPGNFYMWGDGGGVVVVTVSNTQESSPPLIGLNDKTGAEEWHIPGQSGQVCAVTSTEILYAVNGQLAVLSVKTGKQISYGPGQTSGGDGQCPAVLPTGVGAQTSAGTVTLTQMVTP